MKGNLMQNLMHAHRQWATRPDDERFSNLEALQNAVDYRKHASEELPRYLGDVWAVASGDDVVLDGLDRQLSFTHWSFKQFCSRLGAPAHYLRDLPAELVARNLNVGIERHSSTSAMVYAQQERVRAFTSRRYGRIYDSDVVEWVRRATAGTSWKQPLANPPGRFGPPGSDAEPGGLYASDRDCFLFLVDEERRVEVGSESLARGFCVWNSEVGAATFGVLTFLYRFVCGNLIIWNAEQVSEVKIRHVGDHCCVARRMARIPGSRCSVSGTAA